jgi:hypothetical protein
MKGFSKTPNCSILESSWLQPALAFSLRIYSKARWYEDFRRRVLVQESGNFRTTQKSKKSDFLEKSDFSVDGLIENEPMK